MSTSDHHPHAMALKEVPLNTIGRHREAENLGVWLSVDGEIIIANIHQVLKFQLMIDGSWHFHGP